MPDLLVALYALPPCPAPNSDAVVRPAHTFEKHLVVAWVGAHFGPAWADECDAAFANRPVSCLVAVAGGELQGFACYDATYRGFFGPLGVARQRRSRGLGTRLLRSTLGRMADVGYAYAVIGGVRDVAFYRDRVAAMPIAGSDPGPYGDRIRPPARSAEAP